MGDIVSPEHQHKANQLKSLLAVYRKAEDLINIGAYVSGSNPKIDQAIRMIDGINDYLRQDISETVCFEESVDQLCSLMPANN